MPLMVDLIGVSGAVFVLIAFVLSSLGKISRRNYFYMVINGIGAFMLVYYAIVSNAIVFAFLNTIWGSIEIYYLVRRLWKRK